MARTDHHRDMILGLGIFAQPPVDDAPVTVPLVYLLRDLFTTADAAPITSPRTCEPGPGTLTIKDTAEACSISGEKLLLRGYTGTGDPSIGSAAIQNTAGTARYARISYPSNTGGLEFGEQNSLNTRFTANLIDNDGIKDKTSPAVHLGAAASFPSTYRMLTVARGGTAKLFCRATSDDPAMKLVWVGVNASAYPYFGVSQWAARTNDIEEIAVLDLPAQTRPGIDWSKWDEDFSKTFTDEATVAADWSTYDGAEDFLIEFDIEFNDISTGMRCRALDASNYIYPYIHASGSFFLLQRSGTNQNLFSYALGAQAGVTYNIKMTLNGSYAECFVDNVLVGTSNSVLSTGSTVLQNDNTAKTNLKVTKYPAKGIATDRVIAPQFQEVGTHEDDCLFYLRNIQNLAGATSFYFRDNGGTFIRLRIYSDGDVLLQDTAATLYNGSVGDVSIGDDVCLVLDGSYWNFFVNGTSLGSGSTISTTTGTAWRKSDTNEDADSAEFFPRDVSALLPEELYA